MDDKNKDYDVGYGKPPKHSQFKKGESGNPNGRPKGTKNLKTDLKEELQEKVQVTSRGKKKMVTKQRAMVMRTLELAMNGNVRATEFITKLRLQYLDDDTTVRDAPLTADENAILNDFFSQWEIPGENGGPSDGE